MIMEKIQGVLTKTNIINNLLIGTYLFCLQLCVIDIIYISNFYFWFYDDYTSILKIITVWLVF